MKLLDDYLSLQKKIYNYFGYFEDWRVFPIDDRTELYWKLNGEYEIEYGDKSDFSNPDCYYSDEIFKCRFLPKSIYRGKKYTMILLDTHTDGNMFLAIYDNRKEV